MGGGGATKKKKNYKDTGRSEEKIGVSATTQKNLRSTFDEFFSDLDEHDVFFLVGIVGGTSGMFVTLRAG